MEIKPNEAADALEAPCPVCHADRSEPCVAPAGKTHNARSALRLAELEATRSKEAGIGESCGPL